MLIKPSTKILQAMEIIGSPELWTKNTLARDSDGVSVNYSDKTAVCYCSLGALSKIDAPIMSNYYLSKVIGANTNGGLHLLTRYNDLPKTEHKDVINMFMTAAFLALSEGK